MTCPSERRPPGARRSTTAVAAAALAVLVLAGCTTSADVHDDGAAARAPREAVRAFLDRLASGDVRGLCRSLSPRAAGELARDFGGASCARTARAMARYVAQHPATRQAVRGTVVLATTDIPLSPAPYRPGSTTTALRVVIDDPVVGSRQALDLRLRLEAGRWQIDQGVNALFTLAGDDDGTTAG